MSFAKSKAKSVMRSAKNFTKGYSDIEIKVRDATSNDPCLPSTRLMAQISAVSSNHYAFMELVNILDKRLNDRGKNWRHVYKALIVLDYLIHDGSDQVIAYIRDNMFIVKTLQQFQYVDEEGRDQGSFVRSKAKDLVSLLDHPDQLSEQRSDRNYWLSRFNNGSSGGRGSYSSEELGSSAKSVLPPYGKGRAFSNSSIPSYSEREDADLKRALEESKRLAELEKERKERGEEELKVAIELSIHEADSQVRKRVTMPLCNNRPVHNTRSCGAVDDLLNLFEGPPVPLENRIKTMTTVPINQASNNIFGLQLGAQQLLGSVSGGLESVKLNPTFAQGSVGYVTDPNAQQGTFYPQPSVLKEQQQQRGWSVNMTTPSGRARKQPEDPFSDLVSASHKDMSLACVPFPSFQHGKKNPFYASNSITPPASRLNDVDPFSTVGMQQALPQKIGVSSYNTAPTCSILSTSLPPQLSATANGNPMLSMMMPAAPMFNGGPPQQPPILLHPTTGLQSQYPMNPPYNTNPSTCGNGGGSFF